MLKLFKHRTHQRGCFGPFNGGGINKLNLGFSIVRGPLVDTQQVGPLLALNQHPNGSVGQLQQLHHRRRNANGVQVIKIGIVLRRIELGDEENFLVAFHRLFEGNDGFVATNKKRHNHAWKHYDVTQGQKG